MSLLTQLLILTPDKADEGILTTLALELIGERFVRPGERTETAGAIRELNEHLGGFKQVSGTIWGGVLNYADRTAILDHISMQPWHSPQGLQVLIRTEEEASYRMWMMRDGFLYECAPEPADW